VRTKIPDFKDFKVYIGLKRNRPTKIQVTEIGSNLNSTKIENLPNRLS
jgi:hypothetical protein